jgi:hypothetical protein
VKGVGKDYSGKTINKWQYATKASSGNQYLTDEGFIKNEYLQIATLSDFQLNGTFLIQIANPNLFLNIVMDENGSFSQSISDAQGRVIKTIDNDGITTGQYVFDINGNLILEIPPAAAVNPVDGSSNVYNTFGKVVKRITPDYGTITYKYNSAGVLCFVQNSNQYALWSVKAPFTVYTYDALGRIATVGLYEGDLSIGATFEDVDPDNAVIQPAYLTVKVRYIYDSFEGKTDLLNFSKIDNSVLTKIDNSVGRTVGVITYSEDFNEDDNPDEKIIEVNSYYEDGKLHYKFLSMPRIPLQTREYFYTPTNELIRVISSDGIKSSITDYDYNKDGQIIRVKKNGQVALSYEFNELGLLDKKKFYNHRSAPSVLAATVQNSYNIRDWVTTLNYSTAGSVNFKESIFYANLPSVPNKYPADKRRYNGDIGYYTIEQPTGNFEYICGYDKRNRLTLLRNGDVNQKNDQYDADFTFDNSGRLLTKIEGYNAGGTPLKNTGNYTYETNKNRLSFLAGADSKNQTDGGQPNFLYDPNGNMILDRSKKNVVIYDWRGMPTEFKFYNQIPDKVLTWPGLLKMEDSENVKLLRIIKMRYDAGSDRVSKEVLKMD